MLEARDSQSVDKGVSKVLRSTRKLYRRRNLCVNMVATRLLRNKVYLSKCHIELAYLEEERIAPCFLAFHLQQSHTRFILIKTISELEVCLL